MAEAVHGPQPAFEGDSLDLLRAVMRGQIKPDPVQMTAALALLNFERPRLAALAVQHGTTLESLVRASLPDEALNNRIGDLLGEAKPLLAAPPEPAADQADALAALRQVCSKLFGLFR